MKSILKEILILCHADLTANLKYDRLTRAILKKHVKSAANCIDVGCHKGEILNIFLRYAPKGEHYAFEPIPYLFENLKAKYKNTAEVFPYALSDTEGQSTFQLIKNAPAYSGIKRRKYPIRKPDIEEIIVIKKRLDEIIPETQTIDFIKIDVEGGEFDVLKGATQLLKRCKPIVLFEFGKGASEFYDASPINLYQFLTNTIGMKIFTLKNFLNERKSLTDKEFETCYNLGSAYYFVATKD